jgi:outer membrane protein assembly factor BamB
MRRIIFSSVLVGLIAAYALGPALAQQGSVLTYHGDPGRSGNFMVPGLTWERARSMHLDENFHARFSGHVYAQPLYWRPPGSAAGMLVVATEDDTVHALDAKSGEEIWRRALGTPVARSSLGCGNINPLDALFSGGKDAMAGLRHFQTLIAADNRLFVAADGRLYAFAFN